MTTLTQHTSAAPPTLGASPRIGELEIVDLEIEATLAHADHGLTFLGPTIRGGLGYVLKRLVQPSETTSRPQDGRRRDAYSVIFEGMPPENRSVMRRYKTVPPPFTLRIAPPGCWDGSPRHLRFSVRLFGESSHWISDIAAAIEQMGSDGLGRHRTRFDVDSMIPKTVMRAKGQEIGTRTNLRAASQDGTLRWRFNTPVQFTKAPAAREAAEFDPLQLILAGRRRWHLMTSLFGHPSTNVPDRIEASDFRVVSRSIKPWSISRFSGRQKRAVPLSGILGEVHIEGPWSRAGDWITAIEHLHLGKHVSFGFGNVQWNQID